MGILVSGVDYSGFISIWVALVIHLVVKPQRGGGNSQALFALGEYSAAGVDAELCLLWHLNPKCLKEFYLLFVGSSCHYG